MVLQGLISILKNTAGLLLEFVFLAAGGQGIELLRGYVGRVVLVTIQKIHDAPKHAPHFVENRGILGHIGDHSRVLEGGGDGEFRWPGVIEKITVSFGLDQSLTACLGLNGFGPKA